MGRLLTPLQRTAPTIFQWGLSTVRAWDIVMRVSCAPIVLATLFAQYAFETGWGNSCWFWNVGNERANLKYWTGDYCELKTADEYTKSGEHVIVGGYFKAFSGIDEGTEEHLRFLETVPQYDRAISVLWKASSMTQTSDNLITSVSAYADALKAGGYYTGSLDAYRRGMTSIASGFFDQSWCQELAYGQNPTKPMNWPPLETPLEWYPAIRTKEQNPALDFIASFFPEEYHNFSEDDQAHLSSMLSLRYDLVG